MQIHLDTDGFKAVHTNIDCTRYGGFDTLRVVKGAKLMEFDENTYAKYNGRPFHNGIIRVQYEAWQKSKRLCRAFYRYWNLSLFKDLDIEYWD